MYRTAKNLIFFTLASAMWQFGLALWAPHSCAYMVPSGGMSSANAGSSHKDPANGGLPETGGAPSGNGRNAHWAQPAINSDSQNYLGCFDDYLLALASSADIRLQIPQTAARENGVIVRITGVNVAPPTPPPRA